MASGFLGSGLAYPMRPGGSGKLPLASGPEKIRQSILLILTTAPGERVMLPDFGCGIHELVFQPNTAGLRGLIQVKVHEALTRWEPRIEVVDVRVETPVDARNYLVIRIDYRLQANNTLFNLVFPFFLQEGVS